MSKLFTPPQAKPRTPLVDCSKESEASHGGVSEHLAPRQTTIVKFGWHHLVSVSRDDLGPWRGQTLKLSEKEGAFITG